MIILQWVGIVLGALIALIILYLAVIIFAPVLTVPQQPLEISKKGVDDEPPRSRKDVSFQVDGTQVSAWLYLPEDTSPSVPCIVMNHGFGGTKDSALEAYALRFQQAGMAVLTYDYRYFGESGGEPRQMFSMPDQVEDCRTAIEYARGLDEIDPDRIALWGTSAGGGYGLLIAAEDRRIACVSAQCSALDSERDGKMALEREGIGFFLRLFVHAQRDKGRSRFGLSPHRIPIVGRVGTLAMLNAPGAFEGYFRLASPGLINEICARVLLGPHRQNPIDQAHEVQCPVLLQICEQDNLVSMDGALDTAERLGDYAEVKVYPIGHFDIYSGQDFERAVGDQLAFFKKHLPGKPGQTPG